MADAGTHMDVTFGVMHPEGVTRPKRLTLPLPFSLPLHMRLIAITALTLLGAASAQAQAPTASAPRRAPVCAQGVKMYDDIRQIPVPHDTVQIPAPDGPIRVTNEAEMEAAEMALRKRAGEVGATGVLAITEEEDDGAGRVTMRRRTVGVFVRADSAAAQKACAK